MPPPLLNRFLQDDVVEAVLEETAPDKRTVKEARLLRRPRTALAGRVLSRAGKRWLKVDRAVANTDWVLDGADDVKDGAFVVGAIAGDVVRLARVVDEGQVEIEALLVRHRLPGDASAAVVAAADAAPSIAAIIAQELPRRRDLRDLVVVTIDGPATRDIDDALACFPADDDGGLRVVVAIADVDAVVGAGSVVDRDAAERGTSVYLPDRVIPMLPRSLSEDRLSLVEGQDRLCLCAELRVDADGRVSSVDVQEGVLRSTARLTYDAVRAFLDDGDAAAVPAAVHDTLRRLRAVAARLSVQRAARGGGAVDRAEARQSFDDEGQPTAVTETPSTSAHLLVERLKVAANEAVAAVLVARGLPGLYRVHDAPDLVATRQLREAAQGLGVEAGFSLAAPLSPLALAAFDVQITGTVVEPAARALLRRLLGPARYQRPPGMHFGLAAPLYLHFTSPIRRYADLVVHRILKRFLRGERDFAGGDLGNASLDVVAAAVDDAARRAAKAEGERTRSLVARALAGRIGETVSARVVGFKPFGALVQLPGIVALLDPQGGAVALGSAVDVVITAVDPVLGRVDVRRA
jgi:ribonuclease R